MGAVNQENTGRESPISRETTRQLSTAPSRADRAKLKAYPPMPHRPTVRQVSTSCTLSAARAIPAEAPWRLTPLKTQAERVCQQEKSTPRASSGR